MYSRHQKVKLKTFFCLLLIVTFAAILYSEITLTRRVFQTTSDLSNQYLGELTERLSILVDKLLFSAKTTAEYLNYSSIVRQFLINEDDLELIQIKRYMDDLLNELTAVDEDIYSVVIYRANRRVMAYSLPAPSVDDRTLWERYRPDFEVDHPTSGFFLMQSEDHTLRYPAYALNVASTEQENFSQIIGSVVVILNPNSLNDILALPAANDHSFLLLLDQTGQEISSSNHLRFQSEAIAEILDAPTTQTVELRASGWLLVCSINLTDQQMSQYNSLIFDVLLQALNAILLLVLLFVLLDYLAIRPITSIYQEIHQMNLMSLPSLLQTKSRFLEISSIANAINHQIMIQEKNTENMLHAQQRLFDAEVAKRASDIFALENQVNPHFMRNTLQCINGIAAEYDVPLITEIVDALSGIYEYSLYEPGVVTLREEVDIVRQYMKIIDIRFDHKFLCNIDVDDNLSLFHIPKMILQPIVENAVYHGFGMNKGHTLSLKAFIELEQVHIVISDDGCGIDEVKLEQIHETLNDSEAREQATANRHVGLVNIYRRMLLYSVHCTMRIESILNQGTTVELTFPLTEE